VTDRSSMFVFLFKPSRALWSIPYRHISDAFSELDGGILGQCLFVHPARPAG
jgi:hypothetical protein